MNPTEIAACLAAGLLLVTYQLVSRRLIGGAIALVSLAGAIAAGLFGSASVLVAFLMVLAAPLARLVQFRALLGFIRTSGADDLSTGWLIPHMSPRIVAAGTTLFRNGDLSDEVFLIRRGRVRLVEFDAFLDPGEMIGEMGIFSPERKRTATAIAEGELELLAITAAKVYELCCRDPRFAFQLKRLILRRMNDRVARHMAEQQAIEARSGEERLQARQQLADTFEASVQRVFAGVTESVTNMKFCAEAMASASDQTTRRSSIVTRALEAARVSTANMSEAASGMSQAVAEIGRNAARSSEIAARAVDQAERSDNAVRQLSQAAGQIGAVVQMITDIASQTNLLALNATIEAARAGEAGRGFAVVAGEVKNLATQTAGATQSITQQIAEMQDATRQVVQDIRAIGETIAQIDSIGHEISSAIEAQQDASARIAENVARVSTGTEEVSSEIDLIGASVGESSQVAAQVLMTASDLVRDANTLHDEVNGFSNRMRAS